MVSGKERRVYSIDDELSVLYFVLRDDGRFLELATSSVCNFKGSAKSLSPVGTMFAAKNVGRRTGSDQIKSPSYTHRYRS
jgi:hypothetical protein